MLLTVEKRDMELIETGYEKYNSIFNNPSHVFNTTKFNELNNQKCDEVKYLVFKDSKYRLGLIAGVRNNMLLSPFSAPFGSFSFADESIRISYIDNAISLLEAYVVANKFDGIRLILPPLFYSESVLSKLMNVLYRSHFKTSNLDIDFYFDLENKKSYNEQILYNARKNLKRSLGSAIEFRKCDAAGDLQDVYDLIKANRLSKGFPMTMSYEDVFATTQKVETDLFLCSRAGEHVAAAIVYHVNEHVVYVPYWGDKAGYSEIRPMNFLAYKIFEHYKSLGKRKVHIGIATENSVPNYGLCEFKESIGCRVIPKYTFTKHYKD